MEILIGRSASAGLINGGFEDQVLGVGGIVDQVIQGWTTVTGPPDCFAGTMHPEPSFRPQVTEGQNEAFMNVFNGSAAFYQTIVDPGQLSPHTAYTIRFDIGNRDVTDNGNLPNNNMDPFISVRAYFALGTDHLLDFTRHVGGAYELPMLSLLPEGTYVRDRSFSLDTSTLADLSQSLTVVFLATSTTTINRGQVDFDNVRLTLASVPEPSAVVLAGIGVVVLVASASWTRRSQRSLATVPRRAVGPQVDTPSWDRRLCGTDHVAWAGRTRRR
jgi:hypothetical protein